MNIESTIRSIIEENLDIDELYSAITQEVEDRIDYAALAMEIVNKTDLFQIVLEVCTEQLGE